MPLHTSSAILFAVVALGVALQLATVSRLGARIVMGRIGRRWNAARRPQATPGARHPAPTAPHTGRHTARRRCRDYRTALRSAQPSAK
ncbi:hypothetical protein [Frigoriglobus tundricola]|uniref:Uncharacterized protein n=1 Tax=Frigoriglobus tundricola TaxID=2774151 RepID=A0A6M5Z1P6_9BACT|nr:hypothetical protein [Frigoriglobus tundricola]QJW99092.1 hypothetical protein FTUN_6690 [Frigoriglobus tundricola]